MRAYVGAALAALLLNAAPAAAQTDCGHFREEYQRAVDEISRTLTRYARCISRSGGQDDCALEYKQLEKAHKSFDEAVLGIRFNCRADRRSRTAEPE
jgi:hypothetical protein